MKKGPYKVLEIIYDATDCSNQVYDYATLHWKQRKLAEENPDLVSWVDGCVPVDGDGFSKQTYREGRGYRLTNSGYEALTKFDPEKFPAGKEHRRFYSAGAASRKTGKKGGKRCAPKT